MFLSKNGSLPYPNEFYFLYRSAQESGASDTDAQTRRCIKVAAKTTIGNPLRDPESHRSLAKRRHVLPSVQHTTPDYLRCAGQWLGAAPQLRERCRPTATFRDRSAATDNLQTEPEGKAAPQHPSGVRPCGSESGAADALCQTESVIPLKYPQRPREQDSRP